MSGKIKIGICEWCIPVQGTDRIGLCKNMGYSGLVLDLGRAEQGFPISNKFLQEKFKELGHIHGISYPTIALNQLCSNGMVDPMNYETIKDMFNVLVDTAEAMEIRMLQIPSFVKGFIRTEDDFQNTARCLRYVCDIANEKGITVGTENGLNGPDNIRMLETVNKDNLKLLFDTANPLYLADGLDGPEILHYIKDYVVEVHMKDVGPKDGDGKRAFVPLGTGEVKLIDSIKILKAANYSGWAQVENKYSSDLLTQDASMLKNEFEIE